MEIKEFRKKSDKELTKLLAEQREKLRDLRFKIESKQYKNYKEMGKLKKDIAKVITVMNEKRHLKIFKSQIPITNRIPKSKSQSS